MSWSKVKTVFKAIAKNIWLVLLFIGLLVAKAQAKRWKKTANSAGTAFRQAEHDVIKGGWKDAGKLKDRHDAAVKKAKQHEKSAEKRLNAITNSDSSIDELLHDYQSDRLRSSTDTA